MKKLNLFKRDAQTNIKREYLEGEEFKDDLILQNISRGKVLAVVVIFFEIVFIIIDIISSLLQVNNSFPYYFYFAMYSVMIAVNLVYLFLINCFYQKRIHTRAMINITALYITMIMVWGSVISLMDQRLYGYLMVFMVNMIVCSIIYLMDAKMMSISYLSSTLILVIGLPFFQSSGNILIGHYVNLLVFVVISWIASRIVYRNYCDNYVIKKLMKQSELLLEKEMEENRIINKKLSAANAQLKELALVDELTGLPNRRSFREYIDKMLQSKDNSDLTMSVIMIDVDNFKQYNDSYGHEKGDQALIAIAKQIDSMVENTDQIAIRWGGEEFIYAAFNKSRENILENADALRQKILDLRISNQSSSISPYITISLGVCTETVASAKNIRRAIMTADQALYRAKNSGRNCAVALPLDKSLEGTSGFED